MVALNFQKQFADAVESGAKTQTVRAVRKGKGQNPARGGALQLYTGMRTKACRKLGEAVCDSVRPIVIHAAAIFLGDPVDTLGGKAGGAFYDDALTDDEAAAFAAADGFQTVDDFIRFFAETHGLPFAGQAIFWGSLGLGPQRTKAAK